jgi:thiol-disulfide isomerase/thioredoxin
MKGILIAVILVFLFALPSLAQGGNAVKAPAISLKDLTGKTVKLSDFKGKVVLLNFWAVWCVPCAAEVPQLVKWQAEYKGRLQIVGITYPPTSTAKVRRFVKDNKISYPILIGSKATKKLFEQTDTLPVTVIIDTNGNLVDRIDGIIFSDEFETKVRTILVPAR